MHPVDKVIGNSWHGFVKEKKEKSYQINPRSSCGRIIAQWTREKLKIWYILTLVSIFTQSHLALSYRNSRETQPSGNCHMEGAKQFEKLNSATAWCRTSDWENFPVKLTNIINNNVRPIRIWLPELYYYLH